MDVIGEDSLKEFAKKYQNARPALDRWLKVTEAATWKTFKDVKATFPATDYCFDIGGNNYRLLTAISFQLGTVTILDFIRMQSMTKRN